MVLYKIDTLNNFNIVPIIVELNKKRKNFFKKDFLREIYLSGDKKDKTIPILGDSGNYLKLINNDKGIFLQRKNISSQNNEKKNCLLFIVADFNFNVFSHNKNIKIIVSNFHQNTSRTRLVKEVLAIIKPKTSFKNNNVYYTWTGKVWLVENFQEREFRLFKETI